MRWHFVAGITFSAQLGVRVNACPVVERRSRCTGTFPVANNKYQATTNRHALGYGSFTYRLNYFEGIAMGVFSLTSYEEPEARADDNW